MGAWGPGSFDNDDAVDWILEFIAEPDLATIRDLLADIAELDYIEVTDAGEVIAAAEVLAAIAGKPAVDLREDLRDAIRDLEAPKALIARARKLVRKIKKSSETQELWDESEGKAAWHAAVDELLARLK